MLKQTINNNHAAEEMYENLIKYIIVSWNFFFYVYRKCEI